VQENRGENELSEEYPASLIG